MSDYSTYSANTIATLACQQFVQTSAADISTLLTIEAISSIDELRQTIWNRLRDRDDSANHAIDKVEKGDKEAIVTISSLLAIEMQDEEFANYLQALAHRISSGQITEEA